MAGYQPQARALSGNCPGSLLPHPSPSMRPAAFACLLLLTACNLTRESNPPRAATEELLISTAVDRAVEGLKLDIPKDTSVYLDTSDFEGTDSKYAVSDI